MAFNFSLRELGYPNLEDLKKFGLTGTQFMDLVRWMERGRRRRCDGWIRKVYPLTGWEIISFIESLERS